MQDNINMAKMSGLQNFQNKIVITQKEVHK